MALQDVPANDNASLKVAPAAAYGETSAVDADSLWIWELED